MNDYRARDERKRRIDAEFARFLDEDDEQTLNDWRTVLKTPEGRRVLATIMKRTKVWGKVSPEEVEYRNAGVDIFAKANEADPNAVIKAFEERMKLEVERKKRIEAIEKEYELKGN